MIPSSGKPMNIGVFGAGCVGLVTGACLAELGNSVVVYDRDVAKITHLREGRIPFYEPGLIELIARNAERFRVTTDAVDAVRDREIVYIAVGTPTGKGGHTDIASVCSAAEAIAGAVVGRTIVVNKSTVPVHTADVVEKTIRRIAPTADVCVISNPEFLREGSAIEDFFHPDRVVLGCDDPWAENIMRDLYISLDAPVIVSDRGSAELIKYVANAFLATRISFINEIAGICERVGADMNAVLSGVGLDRRIGRAYLTPGPGFGGSCLPKDVRALIATATGVQLEPTLLSAVLRVNEIQVDRVMNRLAGLIGTVHRRCISVLGLAFKAGTDDIRESPSLALIRALIASGATVNAHDPVATGVAAQSLNDLGAHLFDDVWACLRNADAFVLATAWPEYGDLDAAAVGACMRGRVVCDLHNLLDIDTYSAAGFACNSIGKAAHPYALRKGASA